MQWALTLGFMTALFIQWLHIVFNHFTFWVPNAWREPQTRVNVIQQTKPCFTRLTGNNILGKTWVAFVQCSWGWNSSVLCACWVNFSSNYNNIPRWFMQVEMLKSTTASWCMDNEVNAHFIDFMLNYGASTDPGLFSSPWCKYIRPGPVSCNINDI